MRRVLQSVLLLPPRLPSPDLPASLPTSLPANLLASLPADSLPAAFFWRLLRPGRGACVE